MCARSLAAHQKQLLWLQHFHDVFSLHGLLDKGSHTCITLKMWRLAGSSPSGTIMIASPVSSRPVRPARPAICRTSVLDRK